MADARTMGVPVLPPEVNASGWDFTIEDSDKGPSIRFGLGAIKNVGENAVNPIIAARKDGSFKDLNDFARRVDLRAVGKRALECLIKVGALDSFGNRGALLDSLDLIISVSSNHFRAAEAGQMSLFGGMTGVTEEIRLVEDVEHRASRNAQLGARADRPLHLRPSALRASSRSRRSSPTSRLSSPKHSTRKKCAWPGWSPVSAHMPPRRASRWGSSRSRTFRATSNWCSSRAPGPVPAHPRDGKDRPGGRQSGHAIRPAENAGGHHQDGIQIPGFLDQPLRFPERPEPANLKPRSAAEFPSVDVHGSPRPLGPEKLSSGASQSPLLSWQCPNRAACGGLGRHAAPA